MSLDDLNRTADYGEIESLEELKKVIGDAGIIIAVDRKDPSIRLLMWGKATLEAIAQEVIPPQALEKLGLILDTNTDQVEHLIAAIRILKGVDDHNLEMAEDGYTSPPPTYDSPLSIYHGLHIAWIALFRSWERIRKHGFESPENEIEAKEQSVDKFRVESGMEAVKATLLSLKKQSPELVKEEKVRTWDEIRNGWEENLKG